MKKLAGLLLTGIVLAGCSTDQEQADTKQEPAVETEEIVIKEEELTADESNEITASTNNETVSTSQQEQNDIITKAIQVAQAIPAHEGYFSVREEQHIDGQYDEQIFDTMYQEDRRVVGENGDYLLHYVQQHELDDNIIDYESYVQPDVAQYIYDGEQHEWVSRDLLLVDVATTDRISYFAPIDYLKLAEQSIITIDKQSNNDYEVVVTLDEEATERLAMHAREPKSYLAEDLSANTVTDATLTIYIQPETYEVTSTNFAMTVKNVNQSNEQIHVAAYHQYMAYELMTTFEPPAEAFESTGLSAW